MLIELPDGDWIDPADVRGLTLMDDRTHGPRVRVDLAFLGRYKLLEFDCPEAARNWRSEFGRQCNQAVATAPTAPR